MAWWCLLLGSCLAEAAAPQDTRRPAPMSPPALQVYQREARYAPPVSHSPFQRPAAPGVPASGPGIAGSIAPGSGVVLRQAWRLAGVLSDAAGARVLLEQGGQLYRLSMGEVLPGEAVRIVAISTDRLTLEQDTTHGLQTQTLHLGITHGGP